MKRVSAVNRVVLCLLIASLLAFSACCFNRQMMEYLCLRNQIIDMNGLDSNHSPVDRFRL